MKLSSRKQLLQTISFLNNLTMKIVLSCLILLTFVNISYTQEVRIELGPDDIAKNQLFTITLTIENERLRNYSPFPEIDGLVKRGTSSSTSTSFVNGKMTSSQSLTQNYQATREGKIAIPDFSMKVNGETYQVKGKTITIGPPAKSNKKRYDPFDPFQDFYNRKDEPSQFIDVEAEAFLALTTNKSSVYVGEGFTTTLAFYVAETNRADMRFFDLGNQITDIVKKIKPDNCWEENFNIDNISGRSVEINGKGYTQYKVFQAAYYPLNQEPIRFPSVGLKMIKYRVAKNPSFFGRNTQEDYETFYSKEKSVRVKPLPPHPLKDRVAVGNYRLQEKINSENLETGQSFNYSFTIVGEGNLSAIEKPQIRETEDFDFYDPNIRQNIRRSANTVRGTKSFEYYGIPNEPGTFDLGNYLNWVYFNSLKERYDTLRSDIVVNVTGESRKNEYISSSDLGSFYDRIEFEENELKSLNPSNVLQIIANLFIFAVLAISAVLVFKKS